MPEYGYVKKKKVGKYYVLLMKDGIEIRTRFRRGLTIVFQRENLHYFPNAEDEYEDLDSERKVLNYLGRTNIIRRFYLTKGKVI